ncbi:MAG: sigma-54 interaction domain-containing protein [Spirochaetota bacterium]
MQAPTFHGMVGSSNAMNKVYTRIRNVSPFDIPILIIGESGSGKELVARAIHSESARRSGPFHAVNTGALTPELIASELFGHEKGAFTGATTAKKGFFEIADGGTLFLDEIGTMGADTQVNLLRIIETQSFHRVGGTTPIRSNVRILAATNVDLRAQVRSNGFRSDLYYRLSVFPLSLPPLRKRREDIPVLAEYFRERFTAQFERPVRGLEPGAMKQLRSYGWPGNVRELSNVIIRLVVGAAKEMITEAEVVEALYQTAMQVPEMQVAPRDGSGGAAMIQSVPAAALATQAATPGGNAAEGVGTDAAPPDPSSAFTPSSDGESNEPTIHAGQTIEDMERQLIEATLREAHGNRTKAAKLLGISRKSLYNKVKAYGIDA